MNCPKDCGQVIAAGWRNIKEMMQIHNLENGKMNWKLNGDIFVLFTRVALFSWGGGPASLALMQREVITAGWATNEEFADAVAVGNALPGPIAPQVSAYVGYKMSGIGGAVSAAMGTVFPTTLLMLVMVAYFFSIKDAPTFAMLKAVRPGCRWLVVMTAYVMAYSVFVSATLVGPVDSCKTGTRSS
jgi:chromate transporter